jgi:hypothetical protein
VAYQRESRVDYLDDEKVRKRVVRQYSISPENGKAVSRLISINGNPVSDAEEPRRNPVRESGEKGRNLALSEDLLALYDFAFAGEELLDGRKTWKLRFKAKPNLSADGFFERLLHAMTGVIWVDLEEAQLAKAEIRLGKKVSFFGGIAGAVERVDLTFIQRRIEPNVWLGESAYIDFSGRKLLSSMRFRCYEKYTDFRRVMGEASIAR